MIESSYAELLRVIDSVEHEIRKAVEFQSDFYVMCVKNGMLQMERCFMKAVCKTVKIFLVLSDFPKKFILAR